MKAFVVDVSTCNGCYNCQLACKDEHVGNDWTPYAKPQPDTGQFWLKVNEFIRGTVPKVRMHYVPLLCMHCDSAPCMEACTVEGALYKRDDGLVIIDPVKCTGCRNCVDSCPYGVIFFNEELNLAQKCTGCAHLLDGKGGKETPETPRCVDACPTEAIRFGEESEFKNLMARAEVMEPGLHASPRVYYLGIPKKFVAGTVYDPVEEEVVVGAACVLTDASGGTKFHAVTDGFGDFWFEDLGTSTYSLEIAAEGFRHKTISSINTGQDVNLGDIPVTKQARKN